ncbi:hypothetical protein GGQ87_001426 [Brevundimonas alba]|uniref:Lipoprotein n=1 Tax=Brevundimonas alba TaxID=74314 RepID=A0A7X6BML0_9CAUL|nr:hypothetical protein [Brevundimonas alba]NJC41168.1 hypothetical protein [Brevundimonas alba]
MSRILLAGVAAISATACLPASTAEACAPLAVVEPNGESYPVNSPRGWARQQAEWRLRSKAVFLAQVSGQRLARDYGVVFTFSPIAPLYDTALPDPVPALARHRGDTCNRPLDLADFVIVYADQTDAGWTVVGFAPLAELQDRPPELPTERQLSRSLYPVPDYPE